MGMLYEPVVHRCSPPATDYGIRYEAGAWWKCDACGDLWEFTYGGGARRWKYRRPTKRVLRKIDRLTNQKET